MSQYNRWDDSQAVPRGPRQDRHPPGYHPGHQQGGGRAARGHHQVERQEDQEVEQAELAESEEFVFKGSTHPNMVLSGLNILRSTLSLTLLWD